MYEQFAYAIQQKYPELAIEGDNYPPPPVRQYGAHFLSYLKLALIVLLISGQNPFTMLGLETPGVVNWALQNKMYACMMLFFVSNAVEGQLISTGAFEVSFNDVPVWSKLDTGRVPSPQEIFQIIENHMRLSHKA